MVKGIEGLVGSAGVSDLERARRLCLRVSRRSLRTRLATILLVVAAAVSTSTACSSSPTDKCGGHAFQSDHGGHNAPLGACGSLVGQPVSDPAGANSASYAPDAPTLTVKAGEALTIGYGSAGVPSPLIYSGVSSSEPHVLAVTATTDSSHLAVFTAKAAGTAQVTIDPLAACGSTTIRCLVVTVTVTSS